MPDVSIMKEIINSIENEKDKICSICDKKLRKECNLLEMSVG